MLSYVNCTNTELEISSSTEKHCSSSKNGADSILAIHVVFVKWAENDSVLDIVLVWAPN